MLSAIWNNIVLLLFLIAIIAALVGERSENRRLWTIITAIPGGLAVCIGFARALF